MSAEPSAEGGGVLPFPSAETITGSHSGSRPGSVEQPIQPARLPDAQTDATAHLPSGITDRTLRQKLYDNVWTAYWLEFIILIIALFVGAAAGALLGIFFYPSASPICSFSRVGDWGPWKECEPICGQKRTRSRNRTLFDLETIDDHKPCINAIETQSCRPLMCCAEKYKDSTRCFDFVDIANTWAQAREITGKIGRAKLPSIHNGHDSSFLKSSEPIWLGLRCFRAGYCLWDDGSQFDFYATNLEASFEELDPNVSEACAIREFPFELPAPVWRLVACNERHHFLNVSLVVPANQPKCSRNPDYCYEFHTKSPLRYYDIERSKMVIVRNWMQSEFLKTLMADKAEDVKYWVGLRCVVDVNEVDGDQYSDWDHGCRWPDNSSIAFSNWTWEQVPRFSKQTTFCVLIDKEGGWHSEPCDNRHPYMEENENHCDKVGQFIWTPWSNCPAKDKDRIRMTTRSNYTRYRQTNVISNSPTCPHFPHINNTLSLFTISKPDSQFQADTWECWPYGGQFTDVRCRATKYEYFDYCYGVGGNAYGPNDGRYGAVMIADQTEADYVIDMIAKSAGGTPSNLFHIGLRCYKSHLEYCYWEHNSIYETLAFHLFADGHPQVPNSDMECVALRVIEQDWVSVHCSTQIPTIWEYRPYCYKRNGWEEHDGSFGPPICDEETGKALIKPLEKFNCPDNDQKVTDCPPSESCDELADKVLDYCYYLATFDYTPGVTLLEINSAAELKFAFELVYEHMTNAVETNLVSVFTTGMYHYGDAWRSASLGTKVTEEVQSLLPTVTTSTDQINRLVIHAQKRKGSVVAELRYELWLDQYTKIRRQELIFERNATCDKFIKFSGAEYEWKYGDNCGWDWQINSTGYNFLNCAYDRRFFHECCNGAKTGAKLSACYKVSTGRLQTQAQVFPRKKILNGAVPDTDAIDMWKETQDFNKHEAFINVYCSRTKTSDDWQCYGNGIKRSDNIFAPYCKKFTKEKICVLVWDKTELKAHKQNKKLKHYILQFQRFDKVEERAVNNCGLEGVDLTRCPRG